MSPVVDDELTDDERVLLFGPEGQATAAARAALAAAGVRVTTVPEAAGLAEAVRAGAGVVVALEEALTGAASQDLLRALDAQPPWSDLQVIVLATSRDAHADATDPAAPRAVFRDANVIALEPPAAALPDAARAALRARRRQYEAKAMLAAAQEAVRRRDEFLALLGHELRNPLGAINSAIQILDRIGSREPEATETRAMIARQTAHLTRLVDDLLDVSRVSSGKIALRRTPVDLNRTARHCVDAAAGAARQQRHEVTFATAPEPVVVEGDPVRLEQVVSNLLTNAIKYTPAGGRIDVSVAREGADAVVRVRDNGVGIAPDLLPRVFDMFTQADDSLDRTQGGLGMGLTLVRRLVQMHGGSAAARSGGLGTGSEFEVRLPVLEGAAAPAAPPARERPLAAATPRHVLIVEDGSDARKALGRLLELWGHHVDLAEDGARGVETALATRPEVAFIDIGLPGLSGYDVARRLRAALGPGIRLIALTGYGQPEDERRAKEAGFNLHLVKPVSPKQLFRLLAGEQVASAPSGK